MPRQEDPTNTLHPSAGQINDANLEGASSDTPGGTKVPLRTSKANVKSHIFGIPARRRHKLNPGLKILQLRLVAAALLLLIAKTTVAFESPEAIIRVIAWYIALLIPLPFIPLAVLEQKRLRTIPILLDLGVISFLIQATGGTGSPAFLLYVFPIMSASRYFGRTWSVFVAAIAILAYSHFSGIVGHSDRPTLGWFGLQTLVLFGVALTTANLARSRDRLEAQLVTAIENIDREILRNPDLQRVMRSILETAIELTNSDLSVVALVHEGEISTTFMAVKEQAHRATVDEVQNARQVIEIIEQHYLRVLHTRKPLSLPERGVFARGIAHLGSRRIPRYWPARLVPLQLEEAPLGILGVFSRNRFLHYTSNDLRRLSSMVPLVIMAHQNAELYLELSSRESETKAHLNLLYEIGGQLKAEKGLDQLFQQVVDLVSERLDAEEAALFVPNDRGERIVKVAVAGPSPEITTRLKRMEREYSGGTGLTWGVFINKTSNLLNTIAPEEAYADVYSEELPSQNTRHYIGVPLVIGQEVLGVIRVLNKKAADYSPHPEKASLSNGGFQEGDLALLTMIATQVASAIRNAKFIERNRYFENLVDNSPDPIYVLDEAARIKEFNKCCGRIWGWSEDEVLGEVIDKYFESVAHAKEIQAALRTREDHVIRDYAARIRSANGETIPISLSSTLLYDRTGKEMGTIGVFKDQRDSLRLEEERMRSEKLAAIGRLAHTTGHDIKHDIGAALNYLESLEHEARDDPETLLALLATRTSITEALNKLQNMLMTAKTRPPEKRVISLKSLLADFAEGARQRAAKADVEFLSTCPEPDTFLFADAEQLRQVLANLFGNSLDAIKMARITKGKQCAGRIEIVATLGEDTVVLTWEDNGCGMSQETVNKLFTPFFTTKDTGSGLGLFITRTIVENHGGNMASVPSEGGGAIFSITLPLYTAQEATESRRLALP